MCIRDSSTSAGNYTDALLTARNNGNSVDWGHTNTAGYGSTLGAHAGSGAPFVGLSCGAGTNSNTFRTYGLKGSLITTDNAGALIFARVPTASADNQSYTESMRILAAGGLAFNGDTAAANALDDYEEGTWTPAYGVSTGSFSSVTYTNQTGYYTKVGDIVTAHGRLDTSAVSYGSASNYLFITGFPYASAVGAYQTGDVSYSYGYTSLWPTNIAFQGSTSYVYLFSVDKSSNTSSIGPSNLANNQTYLYFSITYKAA